MYEVHAIAKDCGGFHAHKALRAFQAIFGEDITALAGRHIVARPVTLTHSRILTRLADVLDPNDVEKVEIFGV